MDPKHERLLAFVRELSRRDGRGPGDFPLHQPEMPDIPVRGPAAGARTSILSSTLGMIKEAEAYRTGVLPGIAGAAPPASISTLAAPPLALTPKAADSFDRALSQRPVSTADLIRLESIVLPTLRPVFDIQNETYENLPTDWNALNTQRAAVEPILRGIGRIQLTGHPSYTLVGTGFVCGPNAILTNRHVAQIFVQGVESGHQLSFAPGVTCAMDMLAEVGSTGTLHLDVSKPVAVSTSWDVAMLRVQALPAGVNPLPLASSAPAALMGGIASIIGYPSYDPFESFADQANIFRAVFDRKRLQPGKLNGRVDVASFGKTVSSIAHDCSTLGGNSGSALLSVDEALIVGIHFSGVTHVSNYAVPTWELITDPAFAGEVLNFV